MNTEVSPQVNYQPIPRHIQANKVRLTLVFGQKYTWHLTPVPQSVKSAHSVRPLAFLCFWVLLRLTLPALISHHFSVSKFYYSFMSHLKAISMLTEVFTKTTLQTLFSLFHQPNVPLFHLSQISDDFLAKNHHFLRAHYFSFSFFFLITGPIDILFKALLLQRHEVSTIL